MRENVCMNVHDCTSADVCARMHGGGEALAEQTDTEDTVSQKN